MRLRGTCISLQGRGALITGASGSGKSTLALRLMALGADLVSDDQTIATANADSVLLSAPAQIAGMIEARGVGLIAVDTAKTVVLRLVIDLDKNETQRLPPARKTEICGVEVPLFHKSESTDFAAAILLYLKSGKVIR